MGSVALYALFLSPTNKFAALFPISVVCSHFASATAPSTLQLSFGKYSQFAAVEDLSTKYCCRIVGYCFA